MRCPVGVCTHLDLCTFPIVLVQEDQAELLEAAGLDPEALAALPPEMRREVLEQVRHKSHPPPPLKFVCGVCMPIL